jgi:DNA-binding SARP family transcriptional activator
MNELLRLSLLGTPQILLGDRPLAGLAMYKKAEALLFYLAVTASSGANQTAPHSRDAIATLLWGEQSDAQAKQNLRTVLSDLRRLVGEHVRIERQDVVFDRTHPYWLDVEVLRRGLEPGASVDRSERQTAVDLYQGEFLHGFHVRDASPFELWVVEQREQIHTLVVTALTGLVDEYAQTGDPTAALAANRRLLGLDPWSEPTHRQQMRLLAQIGDRAAALAQYESCRRTLAAEFGIEPMAETTALYEQIRAGSSKSSASSPKSAVQSQDEPTDASLQTSDPGVTPQVMGHNLPQPTRHYGRQAELTSLRKWAVEDGCYLVGIFGMGGQGKTTLAATFTHELGAAPRQPRDGFRHILWQSLLNAPP